MPSTATTRLRLEKMADGENDGTWGPKMTAALDRIDEAIAGLVTINTTGGTETLTSNNFTSDEARNAIIEVTGTLGSNCTIEIPAVSKLYVVDNQTSGAFTVTVQVSGGTGAEVGQGTLALVKCDGTDCALVGNSAGKQTVWIPAAAMVAATTNGPAQGQIETTTNDVNVITLDFDDGSDEYAHFNVAFPKGWDEGTVTFQVWWTTSATDTDGVAWGLQAMSLSDSGAMDTAWGTAVVVTDDAQSAANDILITSESSAVTIAGSPAEGDICFFRFFRDVSDANDDMTEDARLIGIKLFYTTDTPIDS